MFPEEIAIRKARFTEHRSIAILKSVEAARALRDVCREAGLILQLESKVRRDGSF